MDIKPMRPSSSIREVPITALVAVYVNRDYYRNGNAGTVRPVAGPHTPLSGPMRVPSRLGYELRLIELGSYRVVSATKLSSPKEAAAALRLLGPTRLQPVLVSESLIEFLPTKAQ
jgi:hypothetical protein